MSFFGCNTAGCFGRNDANRVIGPETSGSTLPFFTSTFEEGTSTYTTSTRGELPALKDTEEMLIQAMKGLSVQEREQALESIHAIPTKHTDDLRSQSVKIEQMKILLQENANEAYMVAKNQSPTYVQDHNLLLSFLNGTESGTPEDASKKLLDYLKIKLWLFGKDALCRQICLNDMNAEDMKCMESGAMQYLGDDIAGRPVHVGLTWIHHTGSVESYCKVLFYIYMSCCPETDPDRSEIVIVAYSGARTEAPYYNLQSSIMGASVFHAFPMRLACMHLALDPSAKDFGGRLLFGFMRTLTKHVQARTNVISGSDMFIQYELRRFGIETSTDRFPVDINGELNPRSVQLFLQERRRVENASVGYVSDHSNVSMGIFPTDNDVLFGRGMTYQYHPGNVEFRKFLEMKYASYNSAPNQKQMSAQIDQIIHQITNENGVRFLKFSTQDQIWVEETSKDVIKKKIQYTFRSFRASLKRVQPQQVKS